MSDWALHPATKKLLAAVEAFKSDFDIITHTALLKGNTVEAQAANSKVEFIDMLCEEIEVIKEEEEKRNEA